MTRRNFALVLTAIILFAVGGCSVNTELGGSRIPNSRPDTRITGQPPTLLEAGFVVEFNWTGVDPDGRIVGYEWKISDNGTDGISPRDTLTYDPLTGAHLNPWIFTTANDSLFYVLADQPNFPRDTNANSRSYRSHTIFVRAVDEKGAVDPTPAQMSFTSTTLVPTVRGLYPSLGDVAKYVPSTVTLGYDGVDPDFSLGIPARVRFLWRFAELGEEPNIQEIYTRTQYNTEGVADELIDFDDPNWTAWFPYGATEQDRRISIPDQEDGRRYLFAIQAQDTAGAVSLGKAYQQQVLNFQVSANSFKPGITASENFLGSTNVNTFSEIPAGQPLNFQWNATADYYNGTVVTLRHGWDLVDPDDANDPGWSVPPGLTQQNRFSEERAFFEGDHVFYIRAVDDSGQVSVLTWSIRVIPFVNRDFQLPLLVIDQVVDDQSNQWADISGGIYYDKEGYRNSFWHFLADGEGGVEQFDWDNDRFRHIDRIKYADLVNYKAVLIYARSHAQQLMFSQFRPTNRNDQFVWLAPYQNQGGNVFLVGQSSMESFLEVDTYMVPIMFNTTEEYYSLLGTEYVVGFGTTELPDGSEVQRGPQQYPYLTAGISVLDWSTPLNKRVYGSRNLGPDDRNNRCVGMKGMVLDSEFKDHHLLAPGAIADTLFTERSIDWRDFETPNSDTLGTSFPFNADEFVNANISSRSTPFQIQDCEFNPYTGLCIEPMFRGLARFDWLRNRRSSEGDEDWPQSTYSEYQLNRICGPQALTAVITEEGEIQANKASRTNGLTFGYLSYKTVEDKPGRRADVYWGFDPYRFDHDQSKKAVRWVLEYFGLAINP